LLAKDMKSFERFQDVPEPYQVIGKVKVQSPPRGTSSYPFGAYAALLSAKEEAARLGANALVVDFIKQVGMNLTEWMDIYECEGTAVQTRSE